MSEAYSDQPIAPARVVLDELVRDGFTHASGVPCSLLSGFFHVLQSGETPLHYVPAPREDTALGVATGLKLAGKRPLVLMQNSGLGYSLNVLTSLNLIYKLGLSLVISWRGHGPDAVEHDIIGRELTNLLDLFNIKWGLLDAVNPRESTREYLDSATDPSQTTALIVTKGFSHD